MGAKKDKKPRKKGGKKTGKAAPPARKLLGRAKNAASAFLSSEEGKILKKDIVKTAVALGLVAMAAGPAEAQHTNSVPHSNTHSDVAHQDAAHSNYATHILHNDGSVPQHSSGAHADVAHADVAHSDVAHGNHGSHANTHANHSSHGSHGSGGWC